MGIFDIRFRHFFPWVEALVAVFIPSDFAVLLLRAYIDVYGGVDDSQSCFVADADKIPRVDVQV